MQAENLKWYHFDQNNSGGYFIRNEDVLEDVFIQAHSSEEANAIADDIFSSYKEYCDCCGERWSDNWEGGKDVPTIYSTPYTEEEPRFFRSAAVFYYLDGTRRYYKLGVGFVEFEEIGSDD